MQVYAWHASIEGAAPDLESLVALIARRISHRETDPIEPGFSIPGLTVEMLLAAGFGKWIFGNA